MDTNKLEIRVLAGEDELVRLEKHMPFPPRPAKHRERFAAQRQNKGSYIVAWRNGRPVGHAFLSEDPGARKYKDCPEIQDLFVTPEFQRGGIGTELLLYAETVVKRHNGTKIGLAVDLANDQARKLYERLGYKNLGKTDISYAELDADNNWQRITIDCFYYIKPLT